MIKRHFGNTLIDWAINNFCFETSRQSLEIFTKKFHIDGRYETEWKMSLYPKGKKLDDYGFLSVFERTASDKAPDIVCADLNFWMLDSDANKVNFLRHKGRFRKKDRQQMTLWSITNVRDAIDVKALTCVTISIFCQIIVTFEENLGNVEENLGNVEEPIDFGIRALSDDLLNLYNTASDYDITLKCSRSREIFAHKVILCAQSSYFAEKITNESNVLDLPDVDYETMRDIVEYFYSRNIDCIARNPSVLMIQYAVRWNLAPIKYYYDTHTYQVDSTVVVREYRILWEKGSSYWSVGDTSPFLTDYRNRNAPFFQICLCDSIDGIGIGYLSVFIEVTERALPKHGCLEISILDDDDVMYSKRMKLPGGGFIGVLGMDNFIRADEYDIICEEMSPDNFKVQLKIEEHTDIAFSNADYIDRRKSRRYRHYNCLSEYMTRILKEHLFSDVTIESEGQFIKAHKCILSARSPLLGSMLKQLTDDKLRIPNIKYDVLLFVIYFLYTGVYENDAINEMLFEVYRAADELSLPSLKQKCLSDLQANLRVSSACEALVYSEKHNCIELQNSVLNFILQNRRPFFDGYKWKSLLVSEPSLCHKILEYVRIHDEP